MLLALAPPSRGGKAGVKISLRFEVTNQETTAVNVETVTFSFPGSASPSTLVTVGHSIDAGSNWEWINGDAKEHQVGPADLFPQFGMASL